MNLAVDKLRTISAMYGKPEAKVLLTNDQGKVMLDMVLASK